MVNIGSKYEETKKVLREKILYNTLNPIDTIAKNHSCYFCLNPIQGTMKVLIDEYGNRTSKYFLDEKCYEDAKLFFYHNNFKFSLN